jgi:putative transposase
VRLVAVVVRLVAVVVRRCNELDNAGLEERREAWQQCGVSVTAAGPSAHLPDSTAVRPEYHNIHSQVLQEALTRLDTAVQAFFPGVLPRRSSQAFFRRLRAGQTPGYPGYPRLYGAHRDTSFTSTPVGKGASLDNGFLVLAKIGRIAVRWSRSPGGAPKTVTISWEADGQRTGSGRAADGQRTGSGRAADGWHGCFSCADVPVHPLAATGQETGMDLGSEAFAPLSKGTRVFPPVGIARRSAPETQRTARSRGASRAATAAARR